MRRRRGLPTRSLANSSVSTGRSVNRRAAGSVPAALEAAASGRAVAAAAVVGASAAAVVVGAHLVANTKGGEKQKFLAALFSFPSSAWERAGAKLCFARLR